MAGRVSDPPLDEIQWRSPGMAQQMQGIHSNSVLPYFSNSPFFDQTSNNAVLMSQAMFNQNMLHVVATREAFEGRLKTMSGLEYVVAQEPAEMAPGTGTGVWVIRKQTRRKRPGLEDEITVHSTYFVMGENIYMAPTVGDVIGSRLLSIFTSLNKCFSIASELPSFTPATGHTYLPPPNSSRPKNATAELNLTQTSEEPTPLTDSLASNNKTGTTSVPTSTYLDTRLLTESLNLSLRYGDEYMDENPVTGHPGDFHLSTTGRKGRDKPVAPPLGSKESSQSQAMSASQPSLELKTGEAVTGRKGSRAEKSPKTPGMPKPRRRKSKALVSAGGITPA